MLKFIFYLFSVVFFSLTALICLCLLGRSVGYTYEEASNYLYFAIGMGGYLIFVCLQSRNLGFFQTFSHELTHAVVGLVFGRKLASFHVTDQQGGYIKHTGKLNIFITLAPYVLPIFVYPFLLLQSWHKTNHVSIEAFAGFFFLFHLHCFYHDISPRQSDIRSSGYLRSLVFILTFLPLNIAICLSSAHYGLVYGLQFLYYHLKILLLTYSL